MNSREYLLLIVALLAVVLNYQHHGVLAQPVSLEAKANPDFDLQQLFSLIDLRNNLQSESRTKRQMDLGGNSEAVTPENSDDGDLFRRLLEQRFEFINAARLSEIPSPTQFMRISMNSGL